METKKQLNKIRKERIRQELEKIQQEKIRDLNIFNEIERKEIEKQEFESILIDFDDLFDENISPIQDNIDNNVLQDFLLIPRKTKVKQLKKSFLLIEKIRLKRMTELNRKFQLKKIKDIYTDNAKIYDDYYRQKRQLLKDCNIIF